MFGYPRLPMVTYRVQLHRLHRPERHTTTTTACFHAYMRLLLTQQFVKYTYQAVVHMSIVLQRCRQNVLYLQPRA